MSGKLNLWAFRALVVVAAVLVYYSAMTPWWTAIIRGIFGRSSSLISINAYGLTHNTTMISDYVLSYETPPLLIPIARVFIAGGTVVCVLSTFVRGRWGWRILAIIGLLYLGYSLGFLPIIYEGTGRAPLPGVRFPVQGEVMVFTDVEDFKIVASFQNGYYLAVASALLCIFLALLRRRLHILESSSPVDARNN